MVRRAVIVLVLAVLTGFALLLLAGHGPFAGPNVVAVSDDHGLNLGDLPVLAGWAVGACCCGWLWRRS